MPPFWSDFIPQFCVLGFDGLPDILGPLPLGTEADALVPRRVGEEQGDVGGFRGMGRFGIE
jgi:hypothetical protein